MQVAVVSVWVVERPVHLEVDVVAVRDGRMAVRAVVPAGALDGSAGGRAPVVDAEGVLVRVAAVG